MLRRITVRSYGVEPGAGGPVLPDLYYRTNLLLAPVIPARVPNVTWWPCDVPVLAATG